MKNWSYILLISLAFAACKERNSGSEVSESKTDSLHFASTPILDRNVDSVDHSIGLAKTDSGLDGNQPIQSKRQPIQPYHADDKRFDERYRPQVDSFFKNPGARLRKNDSLLAVLRRRLALEDSLRKLK